MNWMAQVSKCLIFSSLGVALCQSTPPAPQRAPLRQSFDLQVRWNPTPVRVLGASYLVYELHVINFAAHDLSLSRIAVIDSESGGVLGDFRGANLQEVIGRTDPTGRKDKLLIPPAVHVTAYLSVPLISNGSAPRTLRHRVEYYDTHGPADGGAVMEGGVVTVRDLPQLSLGPPLRGGPWVAVYGSDWEHGHRRMLYAVNGAVHIPGRFAIDWIRLDEHGNVARGNRDKTADWYGYGAEVLAVADATVTTTRDDMSESASVGGHPKVALEYDSGNYVTLDLGNARYAFYEHLKPGSIRVRAGDHVRRGEVLGLLGYTGASTGPHLHFHVSDANATLDAEGLPYAFHRFKVLGAFSSIESVGQGMPWLPIKDGTTAIRSDELPASLAVVEFPAGGE
jgi:energy-converting hydrogenase Eha subunit A